MTTLTKIRLDGVEYDLGGGASGAISVEDQTLVLTGWMSPAVPITVTQTSNQTISITSSDSSLVFDSSDGTGWINKGASLSIDVEARLPYIAGNVIVNGEDRGSASVEITAESTLEITAASSEVAPPIYINCGSYNGGVGFYNKNGGGYGSISPSIIEIGTGRVKFTQITAQIESGQYTLAVDTDSAIQDATTAFTLLNESGQDILNDPVVRESTAKFIYDTYNNQGHHLNATFYVKATE